MREHVRPAHLLKGLRTLESLSSTETAASLAAFRWALKVAVVSSAT